MSVTIISYIAYSELNGKPSTLDEFHDFLRVFARSKVVYACSAINCLLKPWQRAEWGIHESLIRESFPPESANLLIEMCTSADHTKIRRLVFHRLQTIFVAKEAIRVCPPDGRDPGTEPFWGGLGRAFLMANDHLHYVLPKTESPTDEKKRILTQFIPVGEYSSRHWLKSNMSRAFLLLSRFANTFRGTPDFIDLSEQLTKVTGLTIGEFYSLGIATLSHYINVDMAALKADSSTLLISKPFFQNTAIDPQKGERFVGGINSDANSYAEALRERDYGPTDFTAFRDKPLYLEGNNSFAIDTVFLADKLDSGVFWTIHNSMVSDVEKERLHRLWGAIFEEYVNWILRESVDNKLNILHESPIFEDNGEQVCDAIVICGSEAAFLEYKGATFTARAKYSGNIELLTGEIDKKLAQEDGGKGVYQLSRSIMAVFRRSSPRRIKGIDVSKLAIVYPVLVTRDSLGGSILLSWYLNTHYQRKINRKFMRPFISTPLFCMSVQGIEELSGYLKEATMTSILHAWYQKDSHLLSTFLAVDNSVTQQIGERSHEGLDQVLDELWDDATSLLFPGHEPIMGPIPSKHLPQT